MKIHELNQRPELAQQPALEKKYANFKQLLLELHSHKLSEDVLHAINAEVALLNNAPTNKLSVALIKARGRMLSLLETRLKLVTENHYQKTWMALGIPTFGMPIGLALGAVLGSMAFLPLGLPLGLGIGALIGSRMDKKAKEEGRQLFSEE